MTPMHRRRPSTLYIIVDTPLRAEERRISGPPATGSVVICSSLDLYIPGFVLCIYANVMPRAVRVCSARMSRHSCAHGFVSSQVGENVRPCLDRPCIQCPQSMQRWTASVADDTRTLLDA